jgi:hypothetical protein
MAELKVAEIGTTLGECMPDRRHLSRTILQSDAHDGQFRSEGSSQMTSFHERRVEICIGACQRSETGPERLDGIHDLPTVDRQDVHPNGRIRRSNPGEVAEAPGCQIHGAGHFVRSVQEGGRNDLWEVADPSHGRVVIACGHADRSGPQAGHDRFNCQNV